MSQDSEKIVQILKSSGYSLTKQRLLLFELLRDHEPQSMLELYERADGQLDRASVYRIIDLFERLGIARRVNIGWKYKIELSDTFADHHHHLTCIKCHVIVPINEARLEAFISQLADENDFVPSEHQVEIQGYCKQCQKSLNM